MLFRSITNQIIDAAITHAHERIDYEFDRAGYETDQRISMIAVGTIGQLVFDFFLKSKQFPEYIHQLQAGKYDDFDFVVNNKICEIKTSAYDDTYKYLNLLYSEDQYKRGIAKEFSYCVQIFINGYNRESKLLQLEKCNQATIIGYIPFSNIEKFKNPEPKSWGDFYKIPLKNLICIDKFQP